LIQLVGNATSGLALQNAARAGLAFVPVGLGLALVVAMLVHASIPRRIRLRGQA
jgi:lipopolysaccharide export system permease protein